MIDVSSLDAHDESPNENTVRRHDVHHAENLTISLARIAHEIGAARLSESRGCPPEPGFSKPGGSTLKDHLEGDAREHPDDGRSHGGRETGWCPHRAR